MYGVFRVYVRASEILDTLKVIVKEEKKHTVIAIDNGGAAATRQIEIQSDN